MVNTQFWVAHLGVMLSRCGFERVKMTPLWCGGSFFASRLIPPATTMCFIESNVVGGVCIVDDLICEGVVSWFGASQVLMFVATPSNKMHGALNFTKKNSETIFHKHTLNVIS